ncbi:MAG TPA: hypothetical protein VJ984_15390 [Xanthomonadales bacterium]|nr:hypothetical protein [Xanthomonadales bacterium]
MERLKFYLLMFVLPAVVFGDGQSLDRSCLANQAPAYDAQKNIELTALNRDMLVGNKFGLFSFVYPALPKNGYPIEFLEDGKIEAMQFGRSRWELIQGELHLTDDHGVLQVFTYDSRCKSLTSPVRLSDQTVLMELAIVRPPN